MTKEEEGRLGKRRGEQGKEDRGRSKRYRMKEDKNKGVARL